jgi:M6 family metalloprotease-like protein
MHATLLALVGSAFSPRFLATLCVVTAMGGALGACGPTVVGPTPLIDDARADADDDAADALDDVPVIDGDVVALTERLVQLGRLFADADDLDRELLLLSLEEVALQRRLLLETLGARDADGFLRARLPADARSALPDAVQGDVEADVVAVGTLRIVCSLVVDLGVDERACSRHLLTAEGELLELQARELPEWLITGQAASARGLRLGSLLVLERSDAIAPMLNAFHLAAVGAQPTVGEQKTLVLLVNYQDDLSEPVTVAQLQNAVFTQTDSFFRENSYGQTFLTGEVHGWFTLPITKGSVDPFAEAELAEQAATAAGVDVTRFGRIVIYETSGPNSATGGFAGLGTVGGNPSYSWLTGVPAVALIAHELGHNFGLMHANRFECGAGIAVSATCPVVEYGDPYDTMGQSFTTNGFASPHFNAYHKDKLGWLDNGVSPPITFVATSGSFTIGTMSMPADGAPKGLRILRSTNATTGEETYLYVEHRARVGFDATLQNGRNASNQIVPLAFEDGVILHLGQSQNRDTSRLIDTSPTDASTQTAGADMIDVAVHVGQTFTDPQTGIQIGVTQATSDRATVTVSLSSTPPPCVRAAPLVSFAPTSQTTAAGTAVSFAATITNLDSVGCAARTFNVAAAAPAPLTLDPLPATLTLNPASSSTLTARVTVPAGTTTGTRSITLTATPSDNAGQATTGSASVVVQDPTTQCARSFPSLAASPASQSAVAGTSLTWQVALTNRDTAGCAGSTFTVQFALPAGFTSTNAPATLSLAPGASGSVSLTATSGATLAAGSYTLGVSAVRSFDNTTATISTSVVYTVLAPPSCVRAVPSIAVSPSSQFGAPGATLAYDVRVENRDSAGCATTSFSLAATVPTGFASSLASSSLSLAPGTATTTRWSVTSPTTAAGQLFSLGIRVTSAADATLTASAGATYGVNATLGVAVRTNKATYVGRDTVVITTDVTSSGAAVAGAAVSLRITDSRGTVTTLAATSDGTGRAVASFRLARRPRTGTWSVAASATSGMSTGSATTTFVVQ